MDNSYVALVEEQEQIQKLEIDLDAQLQDRLARLLAEFDRYYPPLEIVPTFHLREETLRAWMQDHTFGVQP